MRLYVSFVAFALDKRLDTLDRNGESRWTHWTMVDLQQFIFLSIRISVYLRIGFKELVTMRGTVVFRVAPNNNNEVRRTDF